MNINSIKLCNFRQFVLKEFFFKDGLNVIYGENGAGKTTILEAIFTLCLTKSFKNVTDDILIAKDNDFYVLDGLFFTKKGQIVAHIGTNSSIKRIKINDINVKTCKEYIGNFNCVVFSIADFKLFNGNSQDRRYIFDLIFCQISRFYKESNSYYKKLIKQRNQLLKDLQIQKNIQGMTLLSVYTKQIIEISMKLIKMRTKIIDRLNLILKQMNTNDEISINYIPNTPLEELSMLEMYYDSEIKRGVTLFGPHKDDYMLLINGENGALFASQGQTRDAILQLKLSFVKIIAEVTGENPILLLDDVLNELDKKRQNTLLANIDQSIQTIISTSSISELTEENIKKINLIKLEKEKKI